MRGTPDNRVKKIKRCVGDAIATRLRRSIKYANLTNIGYVIEIFASLLTFKQGNLSL